VYLTPEFLETVNHDVAEKRPEWRQKDAHLDLTGGTALLITDHSSFYTVPGTQIVHSPKLSAAE
jgi:hypothetical protein